MTDFVKWQCPQCFQNYKLPSGRTPPDVCSNCAKAAEPAPEAVDIVTEPPKPVDPSFVRVEPAPAPEVFRESRSDPSVRPKATSPAPTMKAAGVTAILSFILVLFALFMGVPQFNSAIGSFAGLITFILAAQSLQLSRITREIYQIRVDLMTRSQQTHDEG